jgi:hypothetical protein
MDFGHIEAGENVSESRAQLARKADKLTAFCGRLSTQCPGRKIVADYKGQRNTSEGTRFVSRLGDIHKAVDNPRTVASNLTVT